MSYFDSSFWLLLLLAMVCYFAHNNTVTYAVLILLFFKFPLISSYLPYLQKYGMTTGIVILTAAMLVPLANGKISYQALLQAFTHKESLLAILIGIFVAWAGMRGVVLLSQQPIVITGLIIGTVVGVAFFKGVPVGPLIAAGLLSFLIGKS